MYRILRLYFCIASRTVAGEVGIFQPVRCFVSGCLPVLTCAYVPQCRHFRSTPGKLGLFLFKLCHWRTPHVWQGMVLHTKRSPTYPTSFRDLPAMSSVLYLCEGITNANANASASAVAFISSIFLKMDKTELNSITKYPSASFAFFVHGFFATMHGLATAFFGTRLSTTFTGF